MQDLFAIAVAVGALMWLIHRVRRSLTGADQGCGRCCGTSCARPTTLPRHNDVDSHEPASPPV